MNKDDIVKVTKIIKVNPQKLEEYLIDKFKCFGWIEDFKYEETKKVGKRILKRYVQFKLNGMYYCVADWEDLITVENGIWRLIIEHIMKSKEEDTNEQRRSIQSKKYRNGNKKC